MGILAKCNLLFGFSVLQNSVIDEIAHFLFKNIRRHCKHGSGFFHYTCHINITAVDKFSCH